MDYHLLVKTNMSITMKLTADVTNWIIWNEVTEFFHFGTIPTDRR